MASSSSSSSSPSPAPALRTSSAVTPPTLVVSAGSPPTLQLTRTSTTGRSVSPRLPRRQSVQERIDDILETARQRAESMSGLSPPVRNNMLGTTPTGGGVLLEEGEDDGPDETTGIVMKGPNSSAPAAMNYQSMAGYTGARSRKTVTTRCGTGNGIGHGNGNGYEQNGGHENGTGNGNRLENDDASKEDKWWKQALFKFQSIELENKGSVARDHLALERTFLAWLRTSLAFASIGVAITQLFRLNTSLAESSSQRSLRHLGKPLGAVFLGISILILFLGYQRYFQAQQWIIKGKFPASRGTIILVSMVAFVLMIISLVVVVVVQPNSSSG